jgi:3-hydroxyisobutyrate dehydrogenase-like beta-hydroxyacid dehydrogenase
MTRVAFIGLGIMGAPMAGHLARKGFDLSVYNRTKAKADAWRSNQGAGRVAKSAADAAHDAALVVTCVGNDADLRAVAWKDDVLGALGPGSVWLDHTTSSAMLAREIAAACSAKGAEYLDAPVSGGESGARAGQLSVMVGGSEGALQRVRDALEAYAKRVVHIGASGTGQLAKMVNQICIAGLLQGLSEGLRFGECAGLDMQRVLEVVSQGAAQSWQMDHRGLTMLERRFDFGFAVDWMRKDLALCLDEARGNGARLAFTEQVLAAYDELSRAGRGREDTSSLIRLLTR